MKTLKEVCKNCTPATHRVYSTNIRRLYKMFSGGPIKTLDELPKNSRWLMGDKLENAYKKLENKIRRHLSSAAMIATKLYEIKADNKWAKFMKQDVKEYEENLLSREHVCVVK